MLVYGIRNPQPRRRRQNIEVVSLLSALLMIEAFCSGPAIAQQMPAPKIDSATIPTDVEIPPNFPDNPIAFFDDYSWRAFIALVWPALKDHRGDPDVTPGQTVGGNGPRVFETYKVLWELFHNDGTVPVGWNEFEPGKYNPCGLDSKWGDLSLGSFSKFSDLGQAGFGSLVGPLVAQPKENPTYVRFMTAYNKIEFEQIVQKQWFLRKNLPAPPVTIIFNNGAVDIKAAWMDMTNAKNPGRYYTRTAFVLDPATGKSSQKTVGLVGLHIVQKTPTRPQWIWSTFEQVDNVPPGPPNGPGTFALNDGSGKPMLPKNPYTLDRVLQAPTTAPFNVVRAKPIHDSTSRTNQLYQGALKNTVWANYQLVMTQWPTTSSNPTLPGDPSNTFPGSPPNDQTAFANTTMETFEQRAVFTSCMACHDQTRVATDFVWSLNDHAFPASSSTPDLLMKNASFRNLRDLLEQSRDSDGVRDRPK
jgi:hypothetical protein